MLRYLAKYPKMGLSYGEDEQPGVLQVKGDTSYGRPHEQYRSVQGVAIYLGSSRQAFVTWSTAECELVGYTEALQCAESISALLELMQLTVPKVLEGDRRAASAQIQNDGGSWRTRHLRLRAWRLREAMADPRSSWHSQHCAGVGLAAHGLTKPLGGQAHRRFLQLLGMTTPEDKPQPNGDGDARVQALHGDQQHGQRLLEHAATALASASAALAVGSENRSLRVVLLLSSVVVGCLSENKDGWTLVENDERKLSRKEQDPETRKKQDPEIRKVQKDCMKDNLQNGTTKMELKEEAYGTCRQDPTWTNDRRGEETVDFQAKSWEVGGCCPGLRAFRMNRDGSQVKSAPTPVGEPNVRAEAEKKNIYMYIPMTVQFAGVSQKTWAHHKPWNLLRHVEERRESETLRVVALGLQAAAFGLRAPAMVFLATMELRATVLVFQVAAVAFPAATIREL